MEPVNYGLLPEGLRDGARRYVEDHILPGSFLQAVFANNLVEAFYRADAGNTADMHDIVMFIYNEAPSTCWGSPAAVKAWVEQS